MDGFLLVMKANHNIFDWFKFRVIPWFTGLGITTGTVTIEVRGRRSGNPVRLAVTRVNREGASYLVSLGGESNWGKNVRVAGGNAVVKAGRSHPVHLVEIPAEQRAAILHAYVNQRAFTHSGSQSARHFFGLNSKPTLMDMAAIADRYPVFEIQNFDHDDKTR
jgi:deazaflavin-dependent oxidoreductase (nitroreductase family)